MTVLEALISVHSKVNCGNTTYPRIVPNRPAVCKEQDHVIVEVCQALDYQSPQDLPGQTLLMLFILRRSCTTANFNINFVSD